MREKSCERHLKFLNSSPLFYHLVIANPGNSMKLRKKVLRGQRNIFQVNVRETIVQNMSLMKWTGCEIKDCFHIRFLPDRIVMKIMQWPVGWNDLWKFNSALPDSIHWSNPITSAYLNLGGFTPYSDSFNLSFFGFPVFLMIRDYLFSATMEFWKRLLFCWRNERLKKTPFYWSSLSDFGKR